MTRTITALPLTSEAFQVFGDVIEKSGADSFPINNGNCMRFHDLADIETAGDAARPMISIVTGEPYEVPLALPMVERHPLGSQAFIPVSKSPFIVIVCPDENDIPGAPKAFLASNGQGVNYKANVWHGVLSPLNEVSDFIVIDRGGEGENLEEYFFDEPYTILAG